jgi:type IV secretion system protein VirB9
MIRPNLLMAGMIACAVPGSGLAARAPSRPASNAVQLYTFVDGTSYRLITAPERVTDIALQPGEALTAVASGDTARWTIGDMVSGSGENRRTHLLVKPFSEGLSTNLVVTTDRRTYHLALESRAGMAMTAISWTYPQDQLIALRRHQEQAAAARPAASALRVESLNFDYAISGDRPAWRPIRAFDDGRQTFILFPPAIAVSEAPPLFILGAHGDAQLVNYRVSGRYYVVDRLFGAAELRLGTGHQQVVRITRTNPSKPGRKGRAS